MPIKLNLQDDDIRSLVKSFGSPLQLYDGSLIV